MKDLAYASREGRLLEAFGAGTAVVVSPVRSIRWGDQRIDCGLKPGTEAGPMSLQLKTWIEEIQYGRSSLEFLRSLLTELGSSSPVLYRLLPRSDDVVFGMTQTGRNAPIAGVLDIVAPVITTVPVRVTFDRSQTAKKILQDNISKFSAECQAACKFENLILIQTQKDRMVSPIGLERIPVIDLDIPAFGIVAECEVADGQVLVSVGYDSNVVSEKQMANILHQFDFLVNQIGREDASMKPLIEMQLLGDNEVKMLEELNQSLDDRVSRLAHELIHERARLQPEANFVCVCFVSGISSPNIRRDFFQP
ncbi:uncharacterized protein BDV17DRAFT_293840 [Aspergillus undulatus]|uniref:uncharacterized protein n=1 Tax=Aspergillus undulatus TaxID=1810928 RepID=UPI003CCE4648